MKLLAYLVVFSRKVLRRLIMVILRRMFKFHGKNFIFDPYGTYSYETISVGDDVFIGPGATLTATKSSIEMGSKIMLGPNVTILGGDHNTTEIGRYMFDVNEKRLENDLSVIIEDDVWIGAGSTILKGVIVGRGSIVAAGSLVRADVPEYSIVAGVPARVIKQRFSKEELTQHKQLLNSNKSAH